MIINISLYSNTLSAHKYLPHKILTEPGCIQYTPNTSHTRQ